MNEIHKTIIELASKDKPSKQIAQCVERSQATVSHVIAKHANLISRTCSKCSKTKPLIEFNKKQDGKYGYRRECTSCRGTGPVVFKLPFSCQKWA